MAQQRIEYEELTPGYEFAPTSYRLDGKTVIDYLRATGDDSRFYEEEKIAPPMVIAALAMAAMSSKIGLPAGAIHISQELEFVNIATIGEVLTSHARVNRRVERGKFHMLTIGINVENSRKATVMTGESSFTLPSAVEERAR